MDLTVSQGKINKLIYQLLSMVRCIEVGRGKCIYPAGKAGTDVFRVDSVRPCENESVSRSGPAISPALRPGSWPSCPPPKKTFPVHNVGQIPDQYPGEPCTRRRRGPISGSGRQKRAGRQARGRPEGGLPCLRCRNHKASPAWERGIGTQPLLRIQPR